MIRCHVFMGKLLSLRYNRPCLLPKFITSCSPRPSRAAFWLGHGHITWPPRSQDDSITSMMRTSRIQPLFKGCICHIGAKGILLHWVEYMACTVNEKLTLVEHRIQRSESYIAASENIRRGNADQPLNSSHGWIWLVENGYRLGLQVIEADASDVHTQHRSEISYLHGTTVMA